MGSRENREGVDDVVTEEVEVVVGVMDMEVAVQEEEESDVLSEEGVLVILILVGLMFNRGATCRTTLLLFDVRGLQSSSSSINSRERVCVRSPSSVCYL